MANGASTMCSHCTHLIRGIILGSCWTEKRLIENMIFQLVWRSRSWIKIYILWNHTFYVFLLWKEFQAASYHGHRIDMILIAKTNFLRSFWPKTMQKLQWEIFNGGWIIPIVSALVFTRLFTDITYDPIHSSNDTNLKSESRWTGLKFIQPLLWLSFANRLIWRIMFGQDDTDTNRRRWPIT